jgi:hypothetical protein
MTFAGDLQQKKHVLFFRSLCCVTNPTPFFIFLFHIYIYICMFELYPTIALLFSSVLL